VTDEADDSAKRSGGPGNGVHLGPGDALYQAVNRFSGQVLQQHIGIREPIDILSRESILFGARKRLCEALHQGLIAGNNEYERAHADR
jgi:hypothetical protein